MLATEHNLYFMDSLLKDIRKSIRENRFLAFKKDFLNRYKKSNQ